MVDVYPGRIRDRIRAEDLDMSLEFKYIGMLIQDTNTIETDMISHEIHMTDMAV